MNKSLKTLLVGTGVVGAGSIVYLAGYLTGTRHNEEYYRPTITIGYDVKSKEIYLKGESKNGESILAYWDKRHIDIKDHPGEKRILEEIAAGKIVFPPTELLPILNPKTFEVRYKANKSQPNKPILEKK